MLTSQKSTRDYKKWILFNNSLTDHQNLYSLYNAIKHGKNTTEISCSPAHEDGTTKYVIACKDFPETLEVTEDERQNALVYLQQHFFKTDNIDEWYKQKQEVKDKDSNHQFLQDEPMADEVSGLSRIEAHPKESYYYTLKLIFGVFGYLIVGALLTLVFLENVALGVTYLIGIGVTIGTVSMLRQIVKGFIVGMIKGNAVRITERQYPQIFQIVAEQAKALQLKNLPEIYVSHGYFNAFVMKFARTKVLMLYSEVVETMLKGDDSILRFVTAHELGHIKQKHLTKDKWLFFANFIPFLGNAYSRGCEYTCDRIGYHFSKKGAIEGILILSTGKEIYTKINIDHFVADSVDSGSFWMWLSEKFSTHPHTSKRLNEIRKYAGRS